LKGYYFITDAQLSRAGNLSDVRQAVAAGAAAVQYRAKTLSTHEMFTEAAALRAVCGHTPFLINDRVDIALAVNADGVHLGQDDLPLSVARRLLGTKRVIGVTVHSLAEAVEAERGGADYLGVSPIFGTLTKLDAGPPAGLRLLEELKRNVRLPLVAIGGINLANATEVIHAGADAVCAISAVVTRENVQVAAGEFRALFRRDAA
jgi:thiamine-phosphate pyrophosphorylase